MELKKGQIVRLKTLNCIYNCENNAKEMNLEFYKKYDKPKGDTGIVVGTLDCGYVGIRINGQDYITVESNVELIGEQPKAVNGYC